jgi:sec-independent protein translocase protein TatC
MSVTGHLGELRRRLLVALGAVAVGTLVSLSFQSKVMALLRGPIERAVEMGREPSRLSLFVEKQMGVSRGSDASERLREFSGELRTISPTEAVLVALKLSFLCGLLLALPVVLQQLWAFVGPALTDRERRAIVPSLYAGTLLFAGGVWFGYYFVAGAVRMLVLLNERLGVRAGWTLANYFAFVVVFLLISGAIFELPLVMLVLARIGIIDPRVLSSRRKYAILVILIVAGILTPPDPFTQIVMAVPLYALFEAGLIVSKILVRRSPAG